jgi:hypothetical protein
VRQSDQVKPERDRIMVNANSEGTLEEWVEPTVTEFDVRDTAFEPGMGLDGGHVDPDCTRS